MLARIPRAARFAIIGVFATVIGLSTAPLQAGMGMTRPPMRIAIQTAEWRAYKDAFITSDGRIVDTANDNISHSEGQGYGLLLAVAADDPATFELVWSFTRTELLIRDDGLVAWKWDPAVTPHVADVNNATDGDLLIAYALGRAAERWRNKDYRTAAVALSEAIAEHMLVELDGETYILPGEKGFRWEDQPDRLIINPSYWFFPALRSLQRLASSETFDRAISTGVDVLRKARFGPRNLPSDWVEVEGSSIAPAPDRPATFGYDSLRIPLYLLLAGINQRELLEPYYADWIERGDGRPMIVDVEDGKTREAPDDPGYRMLAALVACAVRGKPIPDDLRSFSPTQYYPSTLHIIGLSVARGGFPKC